MLRAGASSTAGYCARSILLQRGRSSLYLTGRRVGCPAKVAAFARRCSMIGRARISKISGFVVVGSLTCSLVAACSGSSSGSSFDDPGTPHKGDGGGSTTGDDDDGTGNFDGGPGAGSFGDAT